MPVRRAPRRILLIKPSSLGDVVHALPVAAALKRGYPDARLAWMIASPFAPLLRGHPLIDELIDFDRQGYGRLHRSVATWRRFAGFLASLQARRFDLVVDLQGLFRSGFFALVTGASQRVGFSVVREFAGLAYSRRVDARPVQHAVEKNLRVISALGLPAAVPQFPLALTDAEGVRAHQLLAAAAGRPLESFVAVIPGARWQTKQWRPQRFAALIDRWHAAGRAPCVLLGAPDERDVSARVTTACRTPVIDLTGRTSLRELAALLALAERVLCHDSGPMHIAAALDKPLVALFGPTDPRRCGPYSNNAVIVREPVECLECYQRVCWHHSCMELLSTERVFAALCALDDRVLGRTGAVPECAAPSAPS